MTTDNTIPNAESLMNRNVRTVTPEMSLRDVVRELVRHGIPAHRRRIKLTGSSTWSALFPNRIASSICRMRCFMATRGHHNLLQR